MVFWCREEGLGWFPQGETQGKTLGMWGGAGRNLDGQNKGIFIIIFLFYFIYFTSQPQFPLLPLTLFPPLPSVPTPKEGV